MKRALEAFSNLVKVYATPASRESDEELAEMAYRVFESAIDEVWHAMPYGWQSNRNVVKLVANTRNLVIINRHKAQRINHANPNDKLYNFALAWLGER